MVFKKVIMVEYRDEDKNKSMLESVLMEYKDVVKFVEENVYSDYWFIVGEMEVE